MKVSIKKSEIIQYNVALAITGATTGISQSKLHNKLGFESLKLRSWFTKLYIFYKFETIGVPEYLLDLTPETNHIYSTRSSEKNCNILQQD